MTTFGTFYTPTNTNFAASTCVVTWAAPRPNNDDDGEGGSGVREPRRPLPVDTPGSCAAEAEAD